MTPPTPPIASQRIAAASGVNAFGAALLSRAVARAPPSTNLFLSPASIASALALALAGSPPESTTAR